MLSQWPEHHTVQRFLMGPCGTCIHKQTAINTGKMVFKVKCICLKCQIFTDSWGPFSSTPPNRSATPNGRLCINDSTEEQSGRQIQVRLVHSQIKYYALIFAWGLNTKVFWHRAKGRDWPWLRDQHPPLQTAAPDWKRPASHSPLSLSHCKWTSGSEEEYIHRFSVGNIEGQCTVHLEAFIPVFPLLLCQLES